MTPSARFAPQVPYGFVRRLFLGSSSPWRRKLCSSRRGRDRFQGLR